MEEKKANFSPDLARAPSEVAVYDVPTFVVHDDVFGEVTEGGPNYRSVGWLGTAVLMMKSQIGLGVMSIPAVFNTLGLAPGLICLWIIAGITTWSSYIVGVFKENHPEVYGIDDVGAVLFGRVGRVVLGTGLVLYWICVAGSGMLSLSIALNALSIHGACTAVFLAVAALAGVSLASVQTLGRITWLAWLGIFGIMSSLITLSISVGVQERPAAAPRDIPWKSDWKAVGNPSFIDAASSLGSLVFAFAGTPGFFPVIQEMRNPKDYPRAMLVCQTGVTVTYSVIGIVVYLFCGSYVASPALGSAGPLMKRICYGLALPGLLFTTVFVTHVSAKYIFVSILRGTKHITSNTKVHWVTWLGSTFGTAIVAYIIASAVPVFGGLVSLVGALFGTIMSFQPMGCMWLYDNMNREKSRQNPRWRSLFVFSIFVIVAGCFLMVAGTYGAVSDIISSYKHSGGTSAWSCADNSGST